jgi:thymidylate synthase
VEILDFLQTGEKCLNLATTGDKIHNMKFDSLDSAFRALLHNVNYFGEEVNSRGSKQRELLFQQFEIQDPTALTIHSQARKFSSTYATAEWLWYLSKNPAVNNISKLAKIWSQIQDINGEVESNYGVYLFDQWNWAIDELLGDNDTRRATIVINQPHHKGKNKLDYPCTQYLQFFIRNNRLHLGVAMRSNDIIFGFCNDVFTFALFQQLMLNELNERGAGVELGSYHHHAGSLHLYERHFDMAEEVLAEDPAVQSASSTKAQVSSRFELKAGWTWEKMLEERKFLPKEDVAKREINEFAGQRKKELFVEHIR